MVKMSNDAKEIMTWLTDRYIRAGFPNHKVWNFTPTIDDKVFPELRALGFIEQMGTRGGPFRLTDTGRDFVMANRTDVVAAAGVTDEPAKQSPKPSDDDLQADLPLTGPNVDISGISADPVREKPGKETSMSIPDPKKVFIIHGRNVEARHQMGIFVRALGLVPINFADLRAAMGGTPHIDAIVEKGMAEAQGVIAVFTPDEFASLRPEYRHEHDRPEDICRWQARPNVIFEAGMAFGRDRDRVVFVLFGNPTLFTDVAGIHLLRPTNDSKGDRSTLRMTLAEGMGCAVDALSGEWMTAGDFEKCVQSPCTEDACDPFIGRADPQRDSNHAAPEPDLSSAALAALENMRQECARSGHAEYESINWILESEAEVRAYRELERHGYVEPRDGHKRNWKLTERGVDRIHLRGSMASAGSNLSAKVLAALTDLAAADRMGKAQSTFRALAEIIGEHWADVYSIMVALNHDGRIRVQIPGGYGPDSSFEADLLTA